LFDWGFLITVSNAEEGAAKPQAHDQSGGCRLRGSASVAGAFRDIVVTPICITTMPAIRSVPGMRDFICRTARWAFNATGAHVVWRSASFRFRVEACDANGRHRTAGGGWG